MNRKAKLISIAAGIIALGGAAGGAYAAIPSSSDGVFHACVNNTGPVRSIYMLNKDAGETCIGGYTEKTWNQTGPAGATGATGATGPAGSSAFVRVTATATPVANGGDGYIYDATASCPTGYVATGGGLKDATTGSRAGGIKSGPAANGKGWRVYIVYGTDDQDIGVTAICVAGTTSP